MFPGSHAMPPYRKAGATRRRALELLGRCGDGCTEALMLAHGFPAALLVELVRDGYTTATADRMMAGARTVEVARFCITELGRKAVR